MEEQEKNEIIIYQPDSTLSLDVRVENDTVWLSQAQMAELFQTTRNNITLHIRNIFKEGELQENSVCKESLHTAADGKKYKTKYYNLDVIISTGYRVKSIRGTQFRIWALGIIKDYMLRGHSINQRLQHIENRMDQKFLEHDKRLDELSGKVDFFVRISLPPKEGILFNNQIFDAYRFVNDLIRSAKERIILIDNYIDDTVFTQLDKRSSGVKAIVYTKPLDKQLNLDIKRHNAQYQEIEVHTVRDIHDRFLIIDDTIYHIGASIKDLGRKVFAFSRFELLSPEALTSIIKK